jgi:hypothetical protein
MQYYRQYIRGFNFYKENYIYDIMIIIIDDKCKLLYIRSKCFPSMKTGSYNQMVTDGKRKTLQHTESALLMFSWVCTLYQSSRFVQHSIYIENNSFCSTNSLQDIHNNVYLFRTNIFKLKCSIIFAREQNVAL